MTPTQMIGTATSAIDFTVGANQPAALTSPTQNIDNVGSTPSNAARINIFTLLRNFVVGLVMIVGMGF
ncbi:8027_t:CDS:2 [Ambispora leptoticha]|uniref:8027_t:CDS:1 n=1 Tax=Ambispora leptoticha TaxID=144679 RepID=A0A9N9C2C1_9GLOM|nr:8027_t:CDS:2 [Ambispora leptoticha]